jgi:hypothetical protein
MIRSLPEKYTTDHGTVPSVKDGSWSMTTLSGDYADEECDLELGTGWLRVSAGSLRLPAAVVD